MRRLPLLLAVALLAVAGLAGTAHAAKKLSAAQVATSLQKRHAFTQPGATPKPDMQALNAVASANPSFYLVVLNRPIAGAANAKGSARLLALALQPSDPRATVGVVQGGKLGGASLSYPQERIDKAVADTGGVAATDPTGALTSYAQAVSKPNKNPDDTGGSGSGGGRPFWQWLLLILVVVGIVLVILRMRARSNEQRRRRRGGSIWTAREFHLDRLEALAARHAALNGETAAGKEDAELQDHLQTAGARILALRRTLPNLTSPRELRTVASELDAVEWEILWVEHRVSDQAPPPALQRAFPGLCFFSHEHGLGTEPIELRKPDGTIATVWVSPENRLALERGDAPDVSMVHVGARMVPWPTAPSWYGAYGWNGDDLPGLEYNGQQIWGIDGPEREPEPDFGSAADAPLVSYPAEEAGTPEPSGDVVETSDGELAMPGEEPHGDDATRAWESDGDEVFEAADDPFGRRADILSPHHEETAAHAVEPEHVVEGERETYMPGADVLEPHHDAPPATEPARPSERPSLPQPTSGFEELDEPAPSGLVAEPDEVPSAPSEELFPEPPAAPSFDDEDTLDGVQPERPESTLEWDPFREGDAGDQR